MVRASGLRGYMALMRQLQADPQQMLQRYHIAPAALEDEDALLSLRAVVHLLEASAAVTGCPDFGLRMSHGQDISVLGPLAIAMQNAPTVASAMDYASRYLFVHSPGLVLTLHDSSPLVRKGAELRLRSACRTSRRSARPWTCAWPTSTTWASCSAASAICCGR